MIAKHETHLDKTDIWSALAAPLPKDAITWRQDGRPISRDGRHLARFVAYVEANTVRERLDAVVPGEWDLHLEPLPAVTTTDEDANMGACNFKARLQILGVVREDVGTGKDWKQAATDAFKRVAVRFGIAHELYAYEQNWVQMDGDGKYAKPIEDPGVAYARRYGRPTTGSSSTGASALPQSSNGVADSDEPEAQHTSRATGPKTSEVPNCPDCGGPCWDNRLTKRGNQPDFKCKDRSCGKAVWLEKKATRKQEPEEVEEIPF